LVTHLCERSVSFEECRFIKKNVRILREPNDLFNVRIRKGAIDDIGNLTASGDFPDLLFEKAKGKGHGIVGVPITPGTSIKVSSDFPRSIASLNALSQGPIGSPIASTLLRQAYLTNARYCST
jgi:hypothetical protein